MRRKGKLIHLTDKHTSFYCASLYWICRDWIFDRLKDFGNPVLTESVSTVFPPALACFVSLDHVLVILVIYLFWWPWSVTFDDDDVIVLGCHQPHPDKTADLISKCCLCSDCFTCWPFSNPLPLLRAPCSLRHNSIEISPTVASKEESQVSHFK